MVDNVKESFKIITHNLFKHEKKMSFNQPINKVICLSLLASNLYAFPRGCEVSGFSFNRNHLILNDNGAQTLFMIQNTGQAAVSFEHVETREDVFMSPKLESNLSPQMWSAFSSDIANFYIKCSVDNNPVDCSTVLSVCQYPRAQFPLSNKGTYWISTNKDISQVIKEATTKGIFLKW